MIREIIIIILFPVVVFCISCAEAVLKPSKGLVNVDYKDIILYFFVSMNSGSCDSTVEAPRVVLPEGFAGTMEDGTPVTPQNFNKFLAEYFFDEWGMMDCLACALVAEFSDDAGFQHLLRHRRDTNEMEILNYLFSASHFSKKRMCLIVDLIIVEFCFCDFHNLRSHWKLGGGNLITTCGELGYHWDPENVEVCVCLKAWISLSLWQEVGAQMRLSERYSNAKFQKLYERWTKSDAVVSGCSLQQAIMGPCRQSRKNFLTLLRNAWTIPQEEVMFPKSPLNILYPRASLQWQPPKTWRL